MDLNAVMANLTGQISAFAHANPYIALAILLILAYLIYRKPFFFFSVLLLGLLLFGVLYLIMSVATPGVYQKEKMLQQERKPENRFRPPEIML